MDDYNYKVVISGLDRIPLRTTSDGAKTLMQSFHDGPDMQDLLLDAVNKGKPFQNNQVSL